MKFKILYSIFLVVSLFYSTVPILGPISIRHFLTITMLGMCYFEGGLKLDRFLKWYMLFLLFYTVVEAGSGYSSYVFGKLLGTYLASIALYISSKIIIEKYQAAHLIINILVILGLINAIEAIWQFTGSPIAQILPQILHITLSEEDIAYYNAREDFHGYSVGGLMGIVTSGYFLSATSVLALYNQKGKITATNWIIFSIIFFALFLVQERSGLFSGLLCAFIFYVLFSIHNQKALFSSAFVFILAAIIIIKYIPSHISYEEMRYTSIGISDNRRTQIAMDAIKWIFQNPEGGANYFFNMGGHYPHNYFINAFLYGGIIGGGILIGILFVQLSKIINVVVSFLKENTYSPLLLASCLAYLCYTLNSLFHNYSLVLGGEMIFLLWAMIGSLKDMEDNTFEDVDLEEEERNV